MSRPNPTSVAALGEIGPAEQHHAAQVLFRVETLLESESNEDRFYTELLSTLMAAVGASSGHLWQGKGDQLDVMIRSVTAAEDVDELKAAECQLARTVQSSMVPQAVPLGPNPNVKSDYDRCCLAVPLRDHEKCAVVVTLITYVKDVAQAEAQRSLVAAAVERVHKHFVIEHYDTVSTEYMRLVSAREVDQGVAKHIDSKPMAFEAVNRLQNYLGADRVSLAFKRGETCKIKAISNQAVFDVRSTVVKRLEQVAAKVAKIDETLWYPSDSEELPPSLRSLLDRAIEASNATTIALIPLRAEPKRRDDPQDIAATIQSDETRLKCVGVLILEGMADPLDAETILPRWRLVQDAVANAVANSRRVDSLFLMPVWRSLGTVADWYRGHTRRKALLITAAILIPIIALFTVPAEFKLRGDGVIQPIHRQHIYAEAEGTVDRLYFTDGQEVQQGDVLMQLKNPKLAARMADIEGQLRESESKLETLTVQRVSRLFEDQQEERELVREAASTEARVEGLIKQFKLLSESYEQLEIKSPIHGQIVTWDTKHRLQDRPIERGERLVTVALPTGKWEVELRVPDKRAGYLLRRWHSRQGDEVIDASFVLASQSNRVYRGQVFEIAPSSNVDDKENENVVRVRVRLDEDAMANMQSVKPGTTVIGHLHCGEVSLGYSKLYEFVDWTRRMWFRFVG